MDIIDDEKQECTVCGTEFKRQPGKRYKTCPDCRKSLSAIGHVGGSHTAERHGDQFYVSIGRQGGARISELIKRGKEAMSDDEKKNYKDQYAKLGKIHGEHVKELVAKGKAVEGGAVSDV